MSYDTLLCHKIKIYCVTQHPYFLETIAPTFKITSSSHIQNFSTKQKLPLHHNNQLLIHCYGVVTVKHTVDIVELLNACTSTYAMLPIPSHLYLPRSFFSCATHFLENHLKTKHFAHFRC